MLGFEGVIGVVVIGFLAVMIPSIFKFNQYTHSPGYTRKRAVKKVREALDEVGDEPEAKALIGELGGSANDYLTPTKVELITAGLESLKRKTTDGKTANRLDEAQEGVYKAYESQERGKINDIDKSKKTSLEPDKLEEEKKKLEQEAKAREVEKKKKEEELRKKNLLEAGALMKKRDDELKGLIEKVKLMREAEGEILKFLTDNNEINIENVPGNKLSLEEKKEIIEELIATKKIKGRIEGDKFIKEIVLQKEAKRQFKNRDEYAEWLINIIGESLLKTGEAPGIIEEETKVKKSYDYYLFIKNLIQRGGITDENKNKLLETLVKVKGKYARFYSKEKDKISEIEDFINNPERSMPVKAPAPVKVPEKKRSEDDIKSEVSKLFDKGGALELSWKNKDERIKSIIEMRMILKEEKITQDVVKKAKELISKTEKNDEFFNPKMKNYFQKELNRLKELSETKV